ncbi:hypothetical protein R1flu_023716 [Riccia fluitans]|uniref:Uncharacterized protein n=1 Tax=Riccia fluitans TaxID=41844 RepID=A0ABD1XSX3_9MARC
MKEKWSAKPTLFRKFENRQRESEVPETCMEEKSTLETQNAVAEEGIFNEGEAFNAGNQDELVQGGETGQVDPPPMPLVSRIQRKDVELQPALVVTNPEEERRNDALDDMAVDPASTETVTVNTSFLWLLRSARLLPSLRQTEVTGIFPQVRRVDRLSDTELSQSKKPKVTLQESED